MTHIHSSASGQEAGRPAWPHPINPTPCGHMIPLGSTHLYGAKDGKLAIHSGRQYTLWALDEEAVPLTQICRRQPIHALHSRRDEELTFWIDLRHELTRTIALGCEWLEPIDHDEHTGLFLARINQLMLSAQTHELLKFSQEECHV